VRFWWITVARGSLAFLLGVMALFTGTSSQTLANFIAIYWLIGGSLSLRWALGVRWRRGTRLALAAGVSAIAFATIVLFRELLDDVIDPEAFVRVLGVASVLTGALRVVGAFEVERRTGRRWTLGGLALGSVEILLGLALLSLEVFDPREVAVLIGVWGLVGGTLLLIDGFRVRRLYRSWEHRADPDVP